MKINFSDSGKCHGEIEDAVPDMVKDFINENAEEIANQVESRAKSSAAFSDKTGNLRSAISARKSRYEDGGWIVGAWAPHAWLVEFGHDLIDWRTGKKIGEVPAHPFLRPALDAEISWAMTKFKVGVK